MRSLAGEVSLHGPEEGRAFLTPGGMLPLFLPGGHFSSKLIQFPGKSAGLFFVRIQLTVQAAEHCLSKVRLRQEAARAAIVGPLLAY